MLSVTYRSPGRCRQPHALPFWAENSAGLGAPGTWYFTGWSMVGTIISPPKAARTKEISIFIYRSGPFALKDLVRADGDHDVDIAGRAALRACLALAGHGDDLPIVDAGGDVLP